MLTQAQYTLFTGKEVSFSDDDWTTIVTVASMRLASFLCLDEFPELTEKNLDLAQLLANFICTVLYYQGEGDTINSKRVRNFTITFKSSIAANAFSQISDQYGDIIEDYSKCGTGINVERSRRCPCESAYGF